MHALMQPSYIIVQSLRSERLQGFKLRPSLPPRQGLTTPLPPWQGLWPSWISKAWASALPSLPAANIRVTHGADQRSAGDTGEGDSEGEGNRWPGANLLCTLTLTQSPLHTTLPHPCLFIFYTPTHWHSSFFLHFVLMSPDQFRCCPFSSQRLPSSENRLGSIKVNPMTTSILYTRISD